MIIWLFALIDLLAMIVLIGTHYHFFAWRITATYAVALAGKAFVFNDRFLSFLDVLVAIYMILLLFIEGGTITWICVSYFTYKILVSML